MFSIITPVYNREFSIVNAIESVLRQEYRAWEMILIDDGSTDRTGQVCQKFVEQDSRIQYIYKENGGVCTARNMGLDNAKGDYVLFLDSDDELREDALAVLAEEIALYPCAHLLCFGYGAGGKKWLPVNDTQRKLIDKQQIRQLILPTHINLYPQDKNFLANFVWNKCYRREFLDANNLRFDEKRKTWEDGLFIVNCLDTAETVVLVSEALHISGNMEVEHLSAKFFEGQTLNYLGDEKSFKRRFEDEYDFSGEHYCNANFRVLIGLLQREIQHRGKAAKNTVQTALKEPIVCIWARKFVPRGRFEKVVQRYVLKGKGTKVYFFYQLRKAVVKRLRR